MLWGRKQYENHLWCFIGIRVELGGKVVSLASLAMSLTVGANFSLLFSFSYTYLLPCILFLFALRYFVNYAPLFCTVCKFSYIVCYLTLFLPEFYVSISVTVSVAVDFFSRITQPPTLDILSIWWSSLSSISLCSDLQVGLSVL